MQEVLYIWDSYQTWLSNLGTRKPIFSLQKCTGRPVETRMELSGLNSKVRFIKQGTTPHLLQTVPGKTGGGSLMQWGCFSAARTGRQSSWKSRDILNKKLIQRTQGLRQGRRFTFNKTAALSTQPRQPRCGLETWKCPQTVPVQPEGA